jgi:phytoene dehydrogenase-like protein
MINSALDRLAKTGGECELEDLAGYGFDEVAIAHSGGLALSRARKRRLDQLGDQARERDPAP